MEGLAGKIAIVVGGTRGIGAAVGRRLAAEGAAVKMALIAAAPRRPDSSRLSTSEALVSTPRLYEPPPVGPATATRLSTPSQSAAAA